MKQYAFFFHFNKPESQRRKKVTISIHYRGTCYLVDNVYCFVPTVGRIKTSQPRFVMRGKANNLRIHKNIAFLQ